tara:strand:- start:8 stop:286 length:279 start_codon:yes stop_codon:yes gene_type:complete
MTSEINENAGKKRQMRGKVVSIGTANGKTVVVEVERRVVHAKYKKIVRRRAKYHAHDENNACQLNDKVIIQESRPLSKLKRWVVVENSGTQF